MNRPAQASLGSGVGIALAIALAGAGIQSLGLPPILGGPHLAGMLAGTAPLAHCGTSAQCVHLYNALFSFVAIFAFAALAWRSPLLQACVALVAISPLWTAAIVDPNGPVALVAVALVALAAIETVASVPVAPALQATLAAALAATDASAMPVALAFGALRGRLPFAAAVCVSAIRIWLVRPHVDALAAPATIVILGAAFFVGGPIALATRRMLLSAPAAGGRIAACCLLAFAAVGGGIFASSGDPGANWLAAEIALLVGVFDALRSLRPERSYWIVAALLVVQFGLFVETHRDSAAAAMALRGDDLRGMLARAPADVCVSADEVAKHYVLVDGAFLRAYPDKTAPEMVSTAADCGRFANETTVVTMRDLDVHDWGIAVPLLQAFADTRVPVGVLQIDGTDIRPGTAADTPTGKGAFGNQFDTPLGPVGDFTVLSGYSYAPACIAVRRGQRLVFAAATIPGSSALTFHVASSAPDGAPTAFSGSLPRSGVQDPYRWKRFESKPLPASACRRFIFDVPTAGGAKGRWLTIAGAAVR